MLNARGRDVAGLALDTHGKSANQAAQVDRIWSAFVLKSASGKTEYDQRITKLRTEGEEGKCVNSGAQKSINPK